MIETLTVPQDRFDLDGFIAAYRAFYRAWAGDDADPDMSVPAMEGFDTTPTPLYEKRDLEEELVNRGWMLFFQLHEPLGADSALCIDGQRRDVEEFDIGVADGYGFLVEVHDGQVSLHPALYDGSSGPFPTVALQGQCSVLDECMTDFAKRFVRG
jgi:hypothetical protein